MANGKAQITDLDLTAIDANLSDYLSDIRPYEGFVQCNSPWIGGLLNNVYKKKVEELPEGHKLLRVYKNSIYTLKIKDDYKNEVYKDFKLIGEVETTKAIVEDYIDPYIIDNKNGEYKVICGNFNKNISYPAPCEYNYYIDESNNKFYLTFYPKGWKSLSELEDTETGLITYVWNMGDNHRDKYVGRAAFPIFNNYISVNSSLAQLIGMLKNWFFGTETINNNLYVMNISPYGCMFSYNVTSAISTAYNVPQGKAFGFISCIEIGKSNVWDHQTVSLASMESNNIWSRGVIYPSASEFSILEYAGETSGISINHSILTTNVDNIYRINVNTLTDNVVNKYSGSVIYSSYGKMKKLSCETKTYVDFTINDKYVVFDTVGYLNTINLETGEFFCRSDDWNDRLIPRNANNTEIMYASSWNAQAQVDKSMAFSIQYPQGIMKINPVIDLTNFYSFFDFNALASSQRRDLIAKHTVDIYTSSGISEAAKYNISIGWNDSDSFIKYYKENYINTLYPSGASLLWNTPALSQIISTYTNETLSIMDNEGYVLAKDNVQNPIFGYYTFAFADVTNLFLTQGQIYGINNSYIYSISLAEGVASLNGVITSKLDLELLGAFPTMALFWSKLDKSLYAFTGDAILQKTKEAYRISEIYNVYCDPARLTMIISTDIGVIIIYQNQVMVLDEMKEPIEHIYYDSNSYYLDDLALSLSEQEGYEPQDIKLHTEYYGVGAGVKSVNDCVYLRVAKGKNANGKVKFQSFVLNDKTTASEEKEIVLNDSMFDTVSGSAYIKYQPKNQAGLGFSVKVETTNPIVSMSIGHSPESIGNTINKL